MWCDSKSKYSIRKICSTGFILYDDSEGTMSFLFRLNNASAAATSVILSTSQCTGKIGGMCRGTAVGCINGMLIKHFHHDEESIADNLTHADECRIKVDDGRSLG